MLQTHEDFLEMCTKTFISNQIDKLLKDRFISPAYHTKAKKYIDFVERCHSDTDMRQASYGLLYSLIVCDCAKYQLSDSLHNIDMAPSAIIQYVCKLDIRMMPTVKSVPRIKNGVVSENIVSFLVMANYLYSRTTGNKSEALRILKTPMRFANFKLMKRFADDAKTLMSETRMLSNYRYDNVVYPYMQGGGVVGKKKSYIC